MTRLLFLMVFFLGLTMISTGASAQNWVKIGSTDNAVYYVDAETVKVNGDARIAWAKYNNLVSENGVRSSINRVRINCLDETLQLLYYANYPEVDGHGRLKNSGVMSGAPEPAIPGSMGAGIVKTLCAITGENSGAQ